MPRLADNEAVLADAYALLTEAVTRGRQITPAAEWFVDNYHLIEEQIRTARRHLPGGYSSELPRLVNGTAGTPRVYTIALELISHAHGRVDLEALCAFVMSYQSVQPLLLGELWAIPIMLRLALIENLRRVIASVTEGRLDRERAGVRAETLLDVGASDPSRVVLVLAEMIEDDPTLTNAFVAELASRIQGHGAAMVFPISWLEQRLGEQGQTLERVFQLASQSQAADQVAIGNSIGSLRSLGATDWRDFVEGASVVDRALRADPVYGAMDFATRDRYRHAVEAIAKQSPLSQLAVAEAAIALASESGAHLRPANASSETPEGRESHVGYFLVDAGRRRLEVATRARRTTRQRVRRLAGRYRLPIYVVAIAAITAAITAPLAIRAPPWLGLIGVLVWSAIVATCASQLASAVTNWAATLLVPPAVLPRLDFSKGIPDAHRTLVAVPTMLTNARAIDELAAALEVRFLANRDPNLAFALVTDFPDAAAESADGDAALLDHARSVIEALTAKYAGQPGSDFFLLHRARRWNPREGVWMGWERKRGKLEDLNATLRGDRGRFDRAVGPIEQLERVKYVIALDTDTELPRNAARELAATLGHPLNRPVFDAARGRVTQGYAILQPRVAITLASSQASRFAQMYAGECGIDPYTRAVSDVYQDVFDEGSFIGKGIYDVDAIQRAITGRFPDNLILSHDLLEGAYARSGLVSDLILFEDHPTAYTAEASRRSRWIRGDWQIARWLFGGVPGLAGRARNPISALSRWKIFDNLRRSVVPFALLVLLLAAWLLPGAAWLALPLVAATLVVPNLLTALSTAARRPLEVARDQHARAIAQTFRTQLGRDLFTLACLPYDAFLAVAAIGRAGGRMLFTGRKLLEWRTAADAQRAARASLAGTYATMWVSPTTTIVMLVALALARPDALWLASPVLALWALAPALVWWVGQPVVARTPRLTADDTSFLRGVSRRTWRFFETYVGAEDNDLPPDNVQEDPPVGVAHRTSPTNIGMGLLANLAAYDFGYVGVDVVIARTTRTLATLDRMQRFRGHFYNWYDTRTLEPLLPMYVSTVDSGNLAGHLLTLAAGLEELPLHPVVRPELALGLTDTLAMIVEEAAEHGRPLDVGAVRELLGAPPRTLSGWRDRLERLTLATSALSRTIDEHPISELTWWGRALETECELARAELTHTVPWLELTRAPKGADPALLERLDEVPTLAELARIELALGAERGGADAWTLELRAAVTLAAGRAVARAAELRQLAARCRELGDHDCDLLYDRERQLLAIGYNVADHRLDAGFYDLLASEARLASYIAIASGKLPQEHWFALGRLLTTTGGRPTLLSWSGSMFEYLMPLLVMPSYDGTLLDATYRAVVDRQIQYGREHGIPWGASESGFHETDAQLNYQYRAFGVPGLGFKRGLADDLVIAPYASAMGLMVDAEAACANLRRLADEGQLGGYGFYEAIDYTTSRLPPGKASVTVRSFMAHHQGMAFLSLAYRLLDRPMQRRFEADPALRATTPLLQERVPRTPAIHPHPAEVGLVRPAATDGAPGARFVTTPSTPFPEVHLLSNGRYHVAITNAGGGYSRWRDLAVTRWHEDATRDCWGTFVYVRDVATGSFWSVAHQPTLRDAESYEAIFSQGRAEYRRRDEDLATHVEISVSPEDDIELRRISISNFGETDRTIELTSFAEVVLTQPAADASHRAFSNLFVQTEIVPDRNAILCTRRPRSGGERPPWMVHLMTVQGRTIGDASYETDRATFLGRGRSPVDPAAMHQSTLGNGEGAVLDPIVAIRNTVQIGPDETIQIHVVTGVAETREGAVFLVEKYADRYVAARVLELAWTQAQVDQRRLDATTADMLLYEQLAGSILYANPTLRAPKAVIARNRLGQSGLWAHGISGDLPIALVRIADGDHMELVRQMVRAHAYWRLRGLVVDLVIWNEDPTGYRQNVHEQIMSAIGRVDATLVDRPGGIFVRRADQMSESDSVLIQTIARLIVSDAAGTLAQQVERRPRGEA
ncbi:MAG: cyclic beta 1-2 glucan synthetase, partial [Myxococcota bacterium]|nr:cyclic beta 1-2 glucan synthetase [Myxococcota bacterium]